MRTSQSLSRWRMRTCCRRSRSRRRVSHSGMTPARRDRVFQVFLHGQRQERTKDVAAYRGVGGMEDRPRPHHRLGSQEQVFDLQQVAISQHRLQRRDLGVGAQHEDAVEASLLERACRHQSRMPACPSSRGSCADSGGRPSCRPGPCHPSSIGHRGRPRSPRGPCDLSRPPSHFGRQCSAGPRSSPAWRRAASRRSAARSGAAPRGRHSP